MPSYTNQPATGQEAKIIRKIAFLAFILNLALALIKGVLAVISGSLAVTAGAIDSATDSVASLAVFIGVQLAEKKTRKFPLGLYKVENVISVIIALFIFFGGYEIAGRIVNPNTDTPEISLNILIFMFICTLATYLFGQYALSMGRKTGSPTLLAEGRHRQADVLSSLVVLASVALNYIGWDFTFWGIGIDQLSAAIVLIFIAKAGWELLSEGMRVLLDASIDAPTLSRIRETIKKHPLVTGIEGLIASNAGRFVFIQAEIKLRTADLKKAHTASEEIEENIREEIPRVGRITIHYEPSTKDHYRIALPVNDMQGALSDKFGEAPYFAFLDFSGQAGEIEQDIQLNPYRSLPRGRGIKVANWLVEQDINEIILEEDIRNKGPAVIFRDAGVSITEASVGTLAQIKEKRQKKPHS